MIFNDYSLSLNVMRLFISIDPPPEQQCQIRELMQRAGMPTLKPLPAEQLHITLAFLGEQPPNKLHEIEQAIAPLDIPTMALRCQGVGMFRSGVIWLRIEPDDGLARLQKKLCRQLLTAGIQLESRKFVPHLTLFRCKHKVNAKQLEHVTRVFSNHQFNFTADRLLLKQSRLTPEGAKHSVLTEFH